MQLYSSFCLSLACAANRLIDCRSLPAYRVPTLEDYAEAERRMTILSSDSKTPNVRARRRLLIPLVGMALLVIAASSAHAQDKSIVVSSTTSTQDSGLFGHILPLFKAKTGIDVKVVSQGTGQALDTGRRGDSDVVFVHAKAQEEKFVADDFGVKRYPVMYNDFILIGPKNDPPGVKGRDIVAAFKAIKGKSAPFISRGDRSGTHAAELALWKAAGIDVAGADRGPWYKEIGQGMGAALYTASASNSYVLADRGTWLSFRNRGDLDIIVEGDNKLFITGALV
jgi:tungstate transport system substrate-binding protein